MRISSSDQTPKKMAGALILLMFLILGLSGCTNSSSDDLGPDPVRPVTTLPDQDEIDALEEEPQDTTPIATSNQNFMAAVLNSDLQGVIEALQEGANPDLSFVDNNQALHLVEDPIIAQVILNHGADPNPLDADGHTPLDLAHMDTNTPLVNMLQSHGALYSLIYCPDLFLPVMTAISQSFTACVIHAFEHQGASLEIEDPSNGKTPLHLAAQLGNETLVDFFLAFLEDAPSTFRSRVLLEEDSGGNTPLHLATWQGEESVSLKILTFMMEHQFDLNQKNDFKQTVLHLAVESELVPFVEKLIEYKVASPSRVNLNLKDENLMTPLMLTAPLGNLEIASLLLSEALAHHQADPNLTGPSGLPVLHQALELDQQEIALFLLRHSRTQIDRKYSGQTALHRAVKRNLATVVDALVTETQARYSNSQAANKMNQFDSSGWTPLHHAARLGLSGVSQALILGLKSDFSTHRLDTKTQDSGRQTALELSLTENVRHLLINAGATQ